ncbi:hypothetical protein [Chamaesiphon polymorphus]|nr:hypothetical protein [Chamaesiphon polymorphus]
MNANNRLRCPIVFDEPRREARWRSLSDRENRGCWFWDVPSL